MNHWKCENCDREVDELKEVATTYEAYYGVSSLFPDNTPMYLSVCPYCDSEDLIEIEEDDDFENNI